MMNNKKTKQDYKNILRPYVNILFEIISGIISAFCFASIAYIFHNYEWITIPFCILTALSAVKTCFAVQMLIIQS